MKVHSGKERDHTKECASQWSKSRTPGKRGGDKTPLPFRKGGWGKVRGGKRWGIEGEQELY